MEENKEQKLTYTVKEVAVRIGVSDTTVYTMVRLGEIPHKRIRGRIVFHRPTIENWLSPNYEEVAQ